MSLIDCLIENNYLKTTHAIKAFKKISRADFLPENMRNLAEEDKALSIGYKQTISQPSVVAFMIELLKPRNGDKVLDVGFGSGWTSALLAEMVGARGKVFSVELVSELYGFGKKNISKYGFVESGRVKVFCADGSLGLKESAPFDKIIASASAKKIPQEWKDQLKVGGRIVFPLGNSIMLLKKKGKNKFEEQEYPGFVFVPLIMR